jgi:hypothetical protein
MMPLTLFLNAFHQWISAGESEKVSSTAIYNLSKLLTLCNRSTAPGKIIYLYLYPQWNMLAFLERPAQDSSPCNGEPMEPCTLSYVYI